MDLFYPDVNMLRIFLEMTRRVSMTQPGPQGPDAANDPACLRDPARALGPGRCDNPGCLRDPARALGPEHCDDSTRRLDSASNPSRGLGATYDPACLRDPARASGPGRRGYPAYLRDLARASGLGRHDYPVHLRDSASDPARGLGATLLVFCNVTNKSASARIPL